tara:strand:- start:169 stop:1572 length:1404 start_codon:yes stop_codon:yes gene_type:complete
MQKKETLKFILLDTLMALTSWVLFFMFRKELENQAFEIQDNALIQGTIIICFFWICLYGLSGKYQNVLRASRLQEFYKTLSQTTIGCIIIFFILIIDDIEYQKNYNYYYKSIVFLFSTHFTLTFAFRYILTSRIVKKIKTGKIGFKTIIIGSSKRALEIFNQIKNAPESSGNEFIGIIKSTESSTNIFLGRLETLGTLTDLTTLIKEKKIDEAIIALENEESHSIDTILSELNFHNVVAKIIPNKSDLLLGNVKMSSIHGIPLTELPPSSMSVFESFLKRFLDIIISSIALIILTPLFLINSILIKLSSNGPVFYSQERAGKNRKSFKIIKFRSMYINAEKDGTPKLTQEQDNRVTNWGKIMRKYRIDELPQFYNVLIGEMSIVGPRPEREYFIKKIIKKAPHYKLVFKIRPGITSWGMVKYGYADNVEKMVERLKYDIIYIENLSIFSDIKVLAYTLIIVLQGRGK